MLSTISSLIWWSTPPIWAVLPPFPPLLYPICDSSRKGDPWPPHVPWFRVFYWPFLFQTPNYFTVHVHHLRPVTYFSMLSDRQLFLCFLWSFCNFRKHFFFLCTPGPLHPFSIIFPSFFSTYLLSLSFIPPLCYSRDYGSTPQLPHFPKSTSFLTLLLHLIFWTRFLHNWTFPYLRGPALSLTTFSLILLAISPLWVRPPQQLNPKILFPLMSGSSPPAPLFDHA